MYSILQQTHSIVAFLVLAGLIFSIIHTLISSVQKRSFTDGNRKVALIGLIATHLQFVIGLILYFISPWGISNFSGANMKDSIARLYMLEHPLIMIISAILVTIGYSKAKRLSDSGKRYNNVLIFYSIALVLILSRIPWSVWP